MHFNPFFRLENNICMSFTPTKKKKKKTQRMHYNFNFQVKFEKN